MLDEVLAGLVRHFRRLGHIVQDTPDDRTDVLLTSAPCAEPVPWRQALLFSARRRFNLDHLPPLFTLIPMPPARLAELLTHFAAALRKEPPDPADFAFPGLAPQAARVMIEQGRRGGPILSLERLLQAQSKSIRIILVVGEERPETAYHLDLVGAHPQSPATDPEAFYEDIVLRIVTTVSTDEVTAHEVQEPAISRAQWAGLSVPPALAAAGRALGERNFFTEMVRIADLVHVPAVADSVASQYSEGCFSTWEPELGALIATVTGSARPIDKWRLSDDDLAVIVGVRPDGRGAIVRHVEGGTNLPPSSEAVEMMDMDSQLPRVDSRPVVRSKLHGHRGVSAYDPQRVEYTPLEPPYYHYLVSCATAAQARGIKAAFARARCLQDPADPRQVAFTVLPGHGAVIVEKWVEGKAPLQVIWEYIDAGYLQVANLIPQGPMAYAPALDGRMTLREP